jgi:glycosyltransferase involved in cell wall biosynthesis
MQPEQRSLTVVIPVFNQAAEIGATLTALDQSLAAASFDADVVVVDDGSTDGTASAVRATPTQVPVEVVEQENRGRFEARSRGLAQARGDYCLLLDSRVRLDAGSLRFVEEQLGRGEDREIWNGHVDIDTGVGPFAVFWDVLTRRVWSAYFSDPRTTSYGLAEFERYPKGTTCLFAPRELLVEAFETYRSGYADVRHANDDAPVIRRLAGQRPINISPGFACRYTGRTRLVPFVRHAFHRGTVFVDGHGRRESEWFPIVVALYIGSAACVVLARRRPLALAGAVAAASAAGAGLAVAEHRPRSDAVTMAWVTPIYAAAHVAGMWRGLGMLLRDRVGVRA